MNRRLQVERGDRFFFYGTLVDHAWTYELGEYLEPAMVKGHLYSTGAYPALKLDSGGRWVQGMLWAPKPQVSEGGIDLIVSRLDTYEGFEDSPHDLFSRKLEPVITFDGGRMAWVYEYAGSVRDMPAIRNGSWATESAMDRALERTRQQNHGVAF